MTVTRRSKRRRPSRTRSQLAIPSRSARSAGVRPELGEPALDIGRAHARARPGRRMTWPAESSRDRPERPSGRQTSFDDLLAAAVRRRAAAAPTATARSAAIVRRGHGRAARRARARWTSTDSPLRTTRPAKSDERTSAAILTLRPMRDAARDDRALADDRDAGVEPARLLLVRPVVVRAVADDRALADDDLLVEDRPVDDGARADDRVEHDDRVAHDRADVDPDAGRQDRVDDRAVDHAAVADQAPVDLGRRPDLGRRALLGAGVDDPVLVVQVELRVVVEERACWPPRTTGSCRRPASSRCSGSRRRARRPRASPG